MKSVFVSYSNEDGDFAKRVVDWLEENGHTVWLDKKDIVPGESYFTSIAKGIDKSEAIIPILSHSSAASKWVVREVIYADEAGKTIIPLFKEIIDLPEPVKLAIAGVQHLDFSDADWDQIPWDALRTALGDRDPALDSAGESDPFSRQLRRAAAEWAKAGYPYELVERMERVIKARLHELPAELKDDDGDLLGLLMLASLHYGINWQQWVERNHVNPNALAVLLNLVAGGVEYLRPRLRALAALQVFKPEDIARAVHADRATMDPEVQKIVDSYAVTRKVPDYLAKLVQSDDPGLARRASAVLSEVSRARGSTETKKGKSKLPFA